MKLPARESCRRLVLYAGLLGGAAIALLPARAWAPPLCPGTHLDSDRLVLRVRTATVDGVALDVTAFQSVSPFFLESGCSLDSLDGMLAEPDSPPDRRAAYWGRVSP